MFIANLLALLGGLNDSPKECWKLIIDEPKMPKSMIEK